MRWVSAAAAATLGFVLVPPPVHADISFLTRVDAGVGPAPTAFAVWRTGFVVSDDEGIAVYHIEQGRLRLSERLPGVSFVKSLAVGDVNADGIPDLACADGFNPVVLVYLGRPGGGFAGPLKVEVPSRVRRLKAAALRDGAPATLVLVHDDGVALLEKEAGGRFRAGPLVDTPMSADVALMDLDGNGSLDFVLVDEAENRLTVAMRQDDVAGAEGAADPVVSTIVHPQRILAADVDRDGHGDLVVVGEAGLAVHRQIGPMKFAKPDWVWKTAHLTGIGAGDVDHDGHLDLLAVSRSRGTVTVLRGKGDGRFTRGESYATGRAPEAILLADITHDDLADVLVLNHLGSSVTVLRGRRDGFFDGSPVVLTDSDDLAAIAVADFNVDGRADLAVVSETGGTLTILLGDGAGHFTEAWSQPVGQRPRALVAGNFDADGLPDIAVANFGSDNVAILLGNGRGGFEAPTYIPVGFGPSTIVSGSLQGAHHVDLAVANMLSDSASVLFNDGRGRFPDVVNYPVGERPTYLMIGDLNHDGQPDLVAGSDYSETVTVLYGNGQTLGDPQPNRLAGTARPLVSEDLDGDGRLDLVAANTQGSAVDVLPGVASGTFGGRLTFPVGYHPDVVATGDFNGDGRPDVAVVHGETGTVSILLNTTRSGSRSGTRPAANGHP